MKNLLYKLNVFANIINGAFGHNKNLHTARFSKLNELKEITADGFDEGTSLLIGKDGFNHVLRVRPTTQRRELGNFLVVAPTRGGKGLLATSQLLSWKGSVIINDIKGDLFTQTAGYRSTLGDVYVIDPTGVGHRFDPLTSKSSEDELFSSATHLLFKADEEDGAIFTQRATVMLTQLFLAARMEGHDPFPYVRQMIRSGMTTAALPFHLDDPQPEEGAIGSPRTAWAHGEAAQTRAGGIYEDPRGEPKAHFSTSLITEDSGVPDRRR